MSMSKQMKMMSRLGGFQKRDRWTRAEIEDHQARMLKSLREHAYKNSPFYRKFHAGLTDASLSELPVLTKAELMKNWDDVVTDRSLRLEDVRKFIESEKKPEKFRGKYYVVSTGGTTGLKGIFVYGEEDWITVMLSYNRATYWTRNLRTPLQIMLKPLTWAFVSTFAPWHISALSTLSWANRIFRPIMVDASRPVDESVATLNEFQPRDVLSGYPSILKLLALEQLAGRLKIAPTIVCCTAEALTKDARNVIQKAWGSQPYNIYFTSETAGIASDCPEHEGLHVYEDTVIMEVVDKDNKPVKPGEYGYKILVTVLFNRTLPLIRYEMSDSVMLSDRKCACGMAFRLIEDVQGRVEEIVYMPGRSGNVVPVQPFFFDDRLEFAPVAGWQIEQETERRLKVRITGPNAAFDEGKFTRAMIEALESLGVDRPEVKIEVVEAFARTVVGKTYHIKALDNQKGREMAPELTTKTPASLLK